MTLPLLASLPLSSRRSISRHQCRAFALIPPFSSAEPRPSHHSPTICPLAPPERARAFLYIYKIASIVGDIGRLTRRGFRLGFLGKSVTPVRQLTQRRRILITSFLLLVSTSVQTVRGTSAQPHRAPPSEPHKPPSFPTWALGLGPASAACEAAWCS